MMAYCRSHTYRHCGIDPMWLVFEISNLPRHDFGDIGSCYVGLDSRLCTLTPTPLCRTAAAEAVKQIWRFLLECASSVNNDEQL